MSLSPDGTKLVCLHCNGDISVWRLPLIKLIHRFPLATQPGHDLSNPLVAEEKVNKKDITQFFAADVNWWSNEVNIVDIMEYVLFSVIHFFFIFSIHSK